MAGSAEKWSAIAAIVSCVAAMASAYLSHDSAKTAQQALISSEKMNRETQRATTFSQFQEQYNAVSSRFPARVLDKKFRPKRGTDDYARLEAYWFFCFSEWYSTTEVNAAALKDLWTNYYRPLVADGLETPSLRYVLEDRVRVRGSSPGAWNRYLRELAALARQHQRPLTPDVEKRITLQQ